MKYSIVMPVYLREQEHLAVVEQAISSVKENSEDYELILVDDGSPLVHTMEYALSSVPDVYIRHHENKGIAPSWNDGIAIARGEYITVVNDDITVQVGWLDKLRQALEDETENAFAAPGVLGQQNGMGIIQDYKWFPGYCFMARPTIFHSLGKFDEQFTPFNYEDTDMWTEALESGWKLVRNYSTTITHIGGDVLHKLHYDEVSETNKKKFVAKWGFDPIPVFYGDKEFPL